MLYSCGFKPYLIQKKFDPQNVPPQTDYSQQYSWASLPEIKDMADSVAAELGFQSSVTNAKVDVFFIHPTIYTGKPTDQYIWNPIINNTALNQSLDKSSILHQASVFNESCNIYAPRYCQAHYYAFLTPNKTDREAALEVAYRDVKAAFTYYLKNFNHNKPIVIAAHSQGAYHAQRLLKDFFDNQPLQQKLVMAYLIGFPIEENAFEKIQMSKNENDFGTFVNWNSFAEGYFPDYYHSFGLSKSVCTNPLSWKNDEIKIGQEQNKGAMGPNFTIIPQAISAQCQKGILWVGKPNVKGGIFIKKKIWHSADYNLFYINIRENIKNRIEYYFKNQE
ncbi:MAG: DUF3089 domain-containing protein [Pseudarcicella sp.]|nr:DUF3089 domain-containing protein [Pseudarcicella sp.]MBP6410425.1 DUF3089 domain-containing protein [Pseudarcicella sp.]